jgi:hypothetical protein
MSRLSLLSLLFLPGCFLALDFRRGDGDRDEPEAPADTAAAPVDTAAPMPTETADTAAPLQVRFVLDPAEATIGQTTLLLARVGGDVVAGDVLAVDLGPDVPITALRAIDDHQLAVTIAVAADALPGDVDAALSLSTVGDVVFPGALTLVE